MSNEEIEATAAAVGGAAPKAPEIVIKATDPRAVDIVKNAAKLLTGAEAAAMRKVRADFQKYLDEQVNR